MQNYIQNSAPPIPKWGYFTQLLPGRRYLKVGISGGMRGFEGRDWSEFHRNTLPLPLSLLQDPWRSGCRSRAVSLREFRPQSGVWMRMCRAEDPECRQGRGCPGVSGSFRWGTPLAPSRPLCRSSRGGFWGMLRRGVLLRGEPARWGACLGWARSCGCRMWWGSRRRGLCRAAKRRPLCTGGCGR